MIYSSKWYVLSIYSLIFCILYLNASSCTNIHGPGKISNEHFEITVNSDSGNINILIKDVVQNVVWAEGAYQYKVGILIDEQVKTYDGLMSPEIKLQSDRISIIGSIGDDFKLTHDLIVAKNQPYFSEEMQIINTKEKTLSVVNFNSSFRKKVTGNNGVVLDNYRNDHFQAVPFLRRSDDDPSFKAHDYSISQIMDGNGFVFQTSEITWNLPKRQQSKYFISEGWGWHHGNAILGIFSFNQDNMIFSTLFSDDEGNLCFGGFDKNGLNLSALERFEGLSTINLGLNRYYTISGGYNQIAYHYRDMLDDMGCSFPEDYNPPVHWNLHFSPELSEPQAWKNRELYATDLILGEAQKAKDHHCEALYLDPGWDTAFGSLIWADDRLGHLKDYIDMVRKEYGLGTSLHTPLSPWSTNEALLLGPSPVETWPESSRRLVRVTETLSNEEHTEKIIQANEGPKICLASEQYLDEAEKRLLELCEAGVAFIMFDGTYWNGKCEDEEHGHPIPLLYEDQMGILTELTQRIHSKYPDVLIEMHDMLNGGHWVRCTPVYYKYGLPGSYNENWGFEFMWSPLKHLKDRTALALYYYRLGCNVPVYLHVDLGQDNENSLVFWWYASTVNHLGIGSSNRDKKLMEQQQNNMKEYIQLQDFYKTGSFYGVNEEIHIHTLKEKQEFVINIFNLSDAPIVNKGDITLEEIGLDPGRNYQVDKEWVKIDEGRIIIQKEMKPWDAALAVIKTQ